MIVMDDDEQQDDMALGINKGSALPSAESIERASAVAARNALSTYLDELRALVETAPTAPRQRHYASGAVAAARSARIADLSEQERSLVEGCTVDADGLPYLPLGTLKDCLHEVSSWLAADPALKADYLQSKAVGNSSEEDQIGPYTAEDVRAVHERLHNEMDACGASLHLEVRIYESRKRYLQELREFGIWMADTKWKTGSRQPLEHFTRLIFDDFFITEKKWAEREEHAHSPMSEFFLRSERIRRLRCAEGEKILTDMNLNASDLNSRSSTVDPTAQSSKNLKALLDQTFKLRKMELLHHVADRATALRLVPMKDLSVSQRRRARKISGEVLQWIDSHGGHSNTTEEQLWDQLCRVNETSLMISAAADIVARRNELQQLLLEIRSNITVKPKVIQSLGEENTEALRMTVERLTAWLELNPNPTVKSLEMFIETLTLSASRFGLSLVPQETPCAPLSPSPGEGTSTPTTTTDKKQDISNENERILSQCKLNMLNTACALLEGFAHAKIACIAHRRRDLVLLEKSENDDDREPTSPISTSTMEPFETPSPAKELTPLGRFTRELDEIVAGEKFLNITTTKESPEAFFSEVTDRLVRRYTFYLGVFIKEGVRIPSICWTRIAFLSHNVPVKQILKLAKEFRGKAAEKVNPKV